jgi:hypothetical protein
VKLFVSYLSAAEISEISPYPVDLMWATKVPIVLDKPDDWWAWSSYIKGLAKRKGVWKYIDPDDETITIEEPVDPTIPIPAKPFNQMNADDRWAWQQESKLYDWSYRIYERDRNAMMAIWTAIQTSVSQNQRYILNLDISERQRMIRLRDKLKPDNRSRMSKLIDRFEKLGEKKRNESMEDWLSEWENVIHECEDAGLVGYSGYLASLKFINAVGPLLPVYADIRLAKLEPDGTSSTLEEINRFRHRWERLSDEENQPSFATFPGQSDQSNCSNQRKCICGDYHPFIDCPYIILSKRPASWKADPKIKAKFERVKKTKENVKAAIERAVAQANQEATPNRRIL